MLDNAGEEILSEPFTKMYVIPGKRHLELSKLILEGDFT
jgi:hypothetical protein